MHPGPDTVYVILVVPAVTPVTTPELKTIVAVAVLLLLHVPPVVAFENTAVEPIQTVPGPVLVAGAAFIVTTALRIQPVLSV